MHTQTHLPRLKREQIIFNSILTCVFEYGLFKFTISQIAKDAKCSPSLIKTYFGGITSIRHKVIQYGIDTQNEKILNIPISEMVGL